MPKVIKTVVYLYSELILESAKARARNWYLETMEDQDSCDVIIEDAARVEFNLKPGRDGLDGDFLNGAEETAALIRAEHGPECESHKLAEAYDTRKHHIVAVKFPEYGADNLDEQAEAAIDSAVEEFRAGLQKYYRDMLEKEREFRASDEQVMESIEVNEYTFTETGKRFG